MLILDIRRASTAEMPTFEGNRINRLSPVGVIMDEVEWRVRPQLETVPALRCRVIATHTPISGIAEARTATSNDCYVIGITLWSRNMRLSLGAESCSTVP